MKSPTGAFSSNHTRQEIWTVAQRRSNLHAADLAAHRSDLQKSQGGREDWMDTHLKFRLDWFSWAVYRKYGFTWFYMVLPNFGSLNVPTQSFQEIWSPTHIHTHKATTPTCHGLTMDGDPGWPIGGRFTIFNGLILTYTDYSLGLPTWNSWNMDSQVKNIIIHSDLSYLVGGIPTPLHNRSSSIGMMTFPTYGKKCSSHHQPVI